MVVFNFSVGDVKAEETRNNNGETYYKGWDVSYMYSNGYSTSGKFVESNKWTSGILFWKKNHKQDVYLYKEYFRCLTYYDNQWIYNQGQTLSYKTDKEVSRSVEQGVSEELSIGSEDIFCYKVGDSYSDTVTTSYSFGRELNFNMAKYDHKSYKLASMGYYSQLMVVDYVNNELVSSKYVYAYNEGWGQEIRLVYRY